MPAINYYVPDNKYASLVFMAQDRGVKIKALIDEALDAYLDVQTKETQKQ